MELAIARLVAEPIDAKPDVANAGNPDAASLVRRLIPPGPAPEARIIAELEETVAKLLLERLPVWRALSVID